MSTESLWTRQEVGIRREISADAQPLVRPERPTAALLGSRRALRAGARSTKSLGVTKEVSVSTERTLQVLEEGARFTVASVTGVNDPVVLLDAKFLWALTQAWGRAKD